MVKKIVYALGLGFYFFLLFRYIKEVSKSLIILYRGVHLGVIESINEPIVWGIIIKIIMLLLVMGMTYGFVETKKNKLQFFSLSLALIILIPTMYSIFLYLYYRP